MRWFGYVVRMPDGMVSKQMLEILTQGRRRPCKPRVKLIDSSNPAFQKRGADPRCYRDKKKLSVITWFNTPQEVEEAWNK